jgi:hypothetical protein
MLALWMFFSPKFFFGDCGVEVNSEPHVCRVSILLLEPQVAISFSFIFQVGSPLFFYFSFFAQGLRP